MHRTRLDDTSVAGTSMPPVKRHRGEAVATKPPPESDRCVPPVDGPAAGVTCATWGSGPSARTTLFGAYVEPSLLTCTSTSNVDAEVSMNTAKSGTAQLMALEDTNVAVATTPSMRHRRDGLSK